MLIKSLGCCEDDLPVIDVIDRCCPQVVEKCLGMLPPAEKAAALAVSNIDLQWIADRSSCVWTAGKYFLCNLEILLLYLTFNICVLIKILSGWTETLIFVC
jgi:hypothetical protein